MKALLLASTAVVLSGAAFAAEPAPRTAARTAMAAAPYSWTGCYIGAHAGAGWSRTVFSDPTANGSNFGHITQTPGDTITVHGTGAVVGGQIGCDYQFATNWVVGLAGDFSWAGIKGEANDPFFDGKDFGAPLSLHSRTDFLASATGRIGYAWDRYLLYAKGGAAWSHNKYEINNFFCGTFIGACYSNVSATQLGWTAGAGFEWSFAPNWSVLAEYDHYGFATKDLTFFDTVHGFTFVFGVKQNIDVVKVGFNYRFDGLLR